MHSSTVRFARYAIASLVVMTFVAVIALRSGAAAPATLSFTNTPLLTTDGNSEPAIAISASGTMALTALSWLEFGTNFWSGPFGSTPTLRGKIDAGLQQTGRRVFGGGDADVDLGSTGTLHATTLIFIVNKPFTSFQLGVSAIACRGADSPTLNLSTCTKQIIDTAGDDRQWISSDGPLVYISYHDAANSSLIRVQRSDDDGFTWKKVGNPVVGQGRATGDATFNNTQGPIVADPFSHNVYAVYTAGEPSVQKGTSAAFNNVFVSRSSDGGKSWTAALVAHRPLFTDLSNVFPALAVDPSNGHLAAVWSDAHQVFFSMSTNQGASWSTPVAVNAAPATTAIFPWVAARDGKIDVVYYATTASSKDDPAAIWNVYLAQTLDAGATFVQSLVSGAPNHVGVVCTSGTACAPGTRNLLDLFEVAIDKSGRSGVIYTDDTISKTSSGNPLPQVVLAVEK
jgi:BNR repeat-like domain